MNFGRLSFAGVGLMLGLLAGCGGSSSGVQVVAPDSLDRLQSRVPDDGQYTLYRAYGFNEQNYPDRVERVWTVNASHDQPIGFRWQRPENPWTPQAKMQLEAYVGSQTRNVGPIRYRDEKYLWAGSNANLNGYWQGRNNEEAARRITLQ